MFLISFFLVIFLRFTRLGIVPKGINVDEASYGYDAYSLLETGKDVWGERSVSLKSFGEYKPSGLAYTLIPLVNAFGLSNTTVRLPSAIFGVLTLIVSFLFVRNFLKSSILSGLMVLILGLSPWHFGLSRLFFEANVGLFFIVMSSYFQIKFI